MIEALGATVAPFVLREKPQLSPWLAACFIKNGPCISDLCAANEVRRIDRRKLQTIVGGAVVPVCIGFLRRSAATKFLRAAQVN
jgi:hypothetical protein